MVQKGDFREDLLYRINTIHVEIPPLRERPEDIVPLTEIFLSKYTKIYGKTAMCLSLDAKEKLKAQPWFGNIRELEHTIEKPSSLPKGVCWTATISIFHGRKKAGDKRGDNLGRDGI